MRNPDLDYLVLMERRRDELAEAARSRLIKEAKAAQQQNVVSMQPRAIPHLRDALMLFFAHLLSRAGGSMLSWGCRLQYRYELLAEGVTEKRPSPCA